MTQIEKIKAEIERLKESLPWGSCASQISMECNCKNEAYNEVLSYIDSLEEDPVSNDLEEAASQYPSIICHISPQWKSEVENVFKAGAQWQKENLWKPADGDDLPEVDREVIALVEENEHYKVVFAHRPPEYWDGKNILTGEVTRYKPKRYDKGGWNMPDVKWWLDCELPKMEE